MRPSGVSSLPASAAVTLRPGVDAHRDQDHQTLDEALPDRVDMMQVEAVRHEYEVRCS